MISSTEWTQKSRKQRKQFNQARRTNHQEPRRETEEPVPRTELGFSKLNKKDRRKFSLEVLAEALDDIDNDEDDDNNTSPTIKNTIRKYIRRIVDKEVQKKQESYLKKLNDLELELFKLSNSVTDPSILSNTLWGTIEMNTKTGDKVRSEMQPYLQKNEQMQEQINNLQKIAWNNECRSLLQKMNYFIQNFQPNLWGINVEMKNDYDEITERLQILLGERYQPILRQINWNCRKDKEIQFFINPIQNLIKHS
ncbi:hypothetical protein M9Y10_022208 [Tritrichomonas musculus]|uniref:Uncharacterized protein n=1 Tax=Tritrichomonas musculus TaxID=1915356 RepID=A0ABR2KRS6_9EUKA